MELPYTNFAKSCCVGHLNFKEVDFIHFQEFGSLRFTVVAHR
jgi:hypothetical protein